MQNNPLVTIICMCYNHEKFVIDTLNSVKNQTYKNIQLIIVDDCSNDNSVSVIKNWLINYPDTTFITNKINIGNTKSFNNALQLAKGDYIIDLATDDVLLENCVEKQLEKFYTSNYSNLGIVYGNVALITENGDFDSYYFPVNEEQKVILSRITGDIYQSVLTGGDSVCSVSGLVKKEVYQSLNGYDESLAYEDLDFWIRASRKYNFDFIDDVIVQKRIVGNSHTSSFYKRNNAINKSVHQILKKAYHLNKNKDEDRALLKRVHNTIIHCYKIKNFGLLFKNSLLKIRLNGRIFIGKYN